jgi:hypothetical protein
MASIFEQEYPTFTRASELSVRAHQMAGQVNRVLFEVSAVGMDLATHKPTGVYYPTCDWHGTKCVTVNSKQAIKAGADEICTDPHLSRSLQVPLGPGSGRHLDEDYPRLLSVSNLALSLLSNRIAPLIW